MPSYPAHKKREQSAQECIAEIFHSGGWDISIEPASNEGQADLFVKRSGQCFLVEIKSIAEGRSDRVLPLLSQAILMASAKASAHPHGNAHPMAMVLVDHASPTLAKQVSSFAKDYAPHVAIGVVSRNGLRHFQGEGLEVMNCEPESPRRHPHLPSGQIINLFSDLNQWMLKVLLAPEIPENLLNAPRKRYRSGAELAEAAEVSPMSASRLLQRLDIDGYLDFSSGYIRLVRRDDLFLAWQSAARRASSEIPMKFLIRTPVDAQIKRLLAAHEGRVRLGLFEAANALKFGHVSGVPPYLCTDKLPRLDDKDWKSLVPTPPSEPPDLIVRKDSFPESAFRGAVRQDGLVISDIIQVWLDVSNHPTRGQEQADLIYKKVLAPIKNNRNS